MFFLTLVEAFKLTNILSVIFKTCDLVDLYLVRRTECIFRFHWLKQKINDLQLTTTNNIFAIEIYIFLEIVSVFYKGFLFIFDYFYWSGKVKRNFLFFIKQYTPYFNTTSLIQLFNENDQWNKCINCFHPICLKEVLVKCIAYRMLANETQRDFIDEI